MTNHTRNLGLLIAAMMLGAPLAVAAQTLPPPPPVPPVPPAPLVLMDGRLLDLATVRETTRGTLDLARLAVLDAGWDLQDSRLFTTTAFSGSGDYTAGKDLLSQRKYPDAIARFDRVIAQKTANVDGALYWKAYAQFKLGKTDECMAAIGQLRKDHAQSRYLGDAKALEADARRRAGQPTNPAEADDDEMKLLAINGIKNTDPERAIPLLENVLNVTNSLSVKKRTLFVLAGINQPRAHQILMSYAKGGGNPDLQFEAIRYVAASGDKQTTGAQLMQIYQSTSDVDVKLAVIGALRSNNSRDALFQIVNTTNSPVVVRTSALNGLSGILGPAELWTLYEKETNKDLKIQMVSLFGSMQALDHLTRIVKTEKDLDVRRRAVRQLGNMKSDKTGPMLVDAYTADPDAETRKTVISALFAQNNAEGLVAIARKESSLALKTEIVRRLSEMAPKSKVAADYLMEIIK